MSSYKKLVISKSLKCPVSGQRKRGGAGAEGCLGSGHRWIPSVWGTGPATFVAAVCLLMTIVVSNAFLSSLAYTKSISVLNLC